MNSQWHRSAIAASTSSRRQCYSDSQTTQQSQHVVSSLQGYAQLTLSLLLPLLTLSLGLLTSLDLKGLLLGENLLG